MAGFLITLNADPPIMLGDEDATHVSLVLTNSEQESFATLTVSGTIDRIGEAKRTEIWLSRRLKHGETVQLVPLLSGADAKTSSCFLSEHLSPETSSSETTSHARCRLEATFEDSVISADIGKHGFLQLVCELNAETPTCHIHSEGVSVLETGEATGVTFVDRELVIGDLLTIRVQFDGMTQ
jgi:hypothetical protein